MEKKSWRERTSWKFIAGAAGAIAVGIAKKNEELVLVGYLLGSYEAGKLLLRLVGDHANRTLYETTNPEPGVFVHEPKIMVPPKVDEEVVSEAESYVGFPVPTDDELRTLDREIDRAWEEGRMDPDSRNIRRLNAAAESALRMGDMDS